MNDNIFTFHKTVIGYRHIQEKIPCEDSSVSYTSEDGNFQIIAVGDGHGDPACSRSTQGARFAVANVQKCLTEFAKAICSGDMDISSPRHRRECVEQLTNTVISKWYGAIRNDLLENKIGEEDLREAGLYERAYREGRRLEHLYGTTLIAALNVSKYLILLQQGDGRCDVFFDDGSVEQPIPWDDRCKGSTTTSMCDEDVFGSIRSTVIDTEERRIAACFIGSDGVEDAYYENEENQLGTHRFYMDLCCRIYELGRESFKAYLEDFLPEFSKTGSCDDISVAGIVNLDRIGGLIDEYRETVEQYDYNVSLHKKLEEARSKLISMTRKHFALEQYAADAELALKEAAEDRKRTKDKLEELISQKEELSKRADIEKAELEEYQRESQEVRKSVGESYELITSSIHLFFEEMTNGFSKKKDAYNKMLEEILNYNIQVEKLEKDLRKRDVLIESLKNKADKTKTEFEKYDTQYRKVETELQKMKEKIAGLSERG